MHSVDTKKQRNICQINAMKKNKALEGILQNSDVRNARFLLISKLVNFLMNLQMGFKGKFNLRHFVDFFQFPGQAGPFFFQSTLITTPGQLSTFTWSKEERRFCCFHIKLDTGAFDYSGWSLWVPRGSVVFPFAVLGICKPLLSPCYSSTDLPPSLVSYFCLQVR